MFLFLMFSSLSLFADDIREFEIENISIGDSALDHFSEAELKNAIDEGYKDKRFLTLGMWKEYKIYDVVQIQVKPNDSKYKIHSISGVIVSDNLANCYKKKNEIVNDLSKIFKNQKKTDFGRVKNPVEADPYGGTYDLVVFDFIDGSRMQVSCNDWSEKSEIVDNVKVEIFTQEVKNYLISKN